VRLVGYLKIKHFRLFELNKSEVILLHDGVSLLDDFSPQVQFS